MWQTKKLNDAQFRRGSHEMFLLGTPGQGAPFHIDSDPMLEAGTWQAQIKGVKTWYHFIALGLPLKINKTCTIPQHRYLKPPPECWWECNGGVISTTLKPGDIIVVKSNWWMHSTKINSEGEISVSINNFI